MAVAIEVNVKGLKRLQERLNNLGGLDVSKILNPIGAAIETQTRRRITEERESPEGEAWTEWSESYKKSRHQGHSLLQSSGALVNSIQYLVTGGQVEVGSNLVYAAAHQFGVTTKAHKIRARRKKYLGWPGMTGHPVKEVNHPGSEIPARPYLGISAENEDEILAIVDAWIDRQMRN